MVPLKISCLIRLSIKLERVVIMIIFMNSFVYGLVLNASHLVKSAIGIVL